MFLLLMLVSLTVAILTTALVIVLFRGPIAGILGRIVAEPVAAAWRRYLSFALLVVGISSGVSMWTLERHFEGPARPDAVTAPGAVAAAFGPTTLSTEAWVFEVYRTVLGSLRGLSGALLLFFGIALVVSGIQRGLGDRGGSPAGVAGSGRGDRERGRPRGSQVIAGGRAEGRRPSAQGGSSSGRRGGEGRGRDSEPRRDQRGGEPRRDLRYGRTGDGRSADNRSGNGRTSFSRASNGRSQDSRADDTHSTEGDPGPAEARPGNGDPTRRAVFERRPLGG